ncbi:MAG: sporulation protein YqfC [Clostridium butyricum]|nr:sporulation protein YqfC [Clostridium butyricum]
MEDKFRKSKEKILNKLNFPSDISLDMPKIVVIGNREITIENHKGIIAFENNMVKINSRIGAITINGQKFEILFIGETSMTISGIFNGISYER